MSRDSENQRSTQHGAKADTGRQIDFDAEHRPDIARRASLAGLRREIQKKAAAAATANEAAHDAAARGVATPTTALPHAEQIQASFGAKHDVSRIQAHVGGDSAAAMGATAFASGNHVVFDRPPDLHTAAHEAAHVVQQAHGVNLYGGVGQAGDAYERHADAVADHVVAGQSAADLLGAPAASPSSLSTVQRKEAPVPSEASPQQQHQQHAKADTASFQGLQSAIALAAKQVQGAADDIMKLLSAPVTEAGASAHVHAMQQCIDRVSTNLHLLNTNIGSVTRESSGMPKEYQQLLPELGKLRTAFARFEPVVARADQFASQHGEKLEAKKQLAAAHGYLDELQEKLGAKGIELRARDVDETPAADMLTTALKDNMGAIHEAVLSARMGLTSADDQIVLGDVRKVKRHTGQVATLLQQISDPKVLKVQAAGARGILRELQKLQNELHKKPALENELKGGEFPRYLHDIQSKIGH